jgi:hypothetical protein
MGEHMHFCSECGLEWRCHETDCAAAHEMYCHECALENEQETEETLANRVAVNEKLENNKS